jgi:hypothetical protein
LLLRFGGVWVAVKFCFFVFVFSSRGGSFRASFLALRRCF